MPNSDFVEGVSIESQQLSVGRREETSAFGRGSGRDPCSGKIRGSTSLDRPNQAVTITPVDIQNLGLTFEFKIEGGTYQADNTFSGLSEGKKTFYIRGSDNGCEEAVTEEVIHCDISLSASSEDEQYDQSDGSITATVSTPSSNIEWSFNGGSWQTGGDTESWAGLDDGVYTVKARDEWGCVASKDVFVGNIKDTYPPTVPQNLTVTTAQNVFTLDWDASTDDEASISHYRVYRSQTSGFTANSGTLLYDNIADTTVQDSGLSKGTYYYKVSAVDTNGNESSPSAEKSGYAEGQAPQWDDKGNLVINQAPSWDNQNQLTLVNDSPSWSSDNYTYRG